MKNFKKQFMSITKEKASEINGGVKERGQHLNTDLKGKMDLGRYQYKTTIVIIRTYDSVVQQITCEKDGYTLIFQVK